MKLNEMILLLKDSAKHGAQKVVAETTKPSERITKSEAYRRYGRSSVDRWFREGLLKPVSHTGKRSPNRIDIRNLEAVAASGNRGTYLPVADR